MKMRNYIKDFSNHISESIKIGETLKFKINEKQFSNVLICGLGGSGIGGDILKDIVSSQIKIPVLINKHYSIPNFVDKNTLVIVSSYSGNTEETISALQKCQAKKSEVVIITSGGELKKIAETNNYNHVIIPDGHPPRAMFGYSFVQLFYVLFYYNIITDTFKLDFRNAVKLLISQNKKIKKTAVEIAEKLYTKTPVIYTAEGFEGVAVRFRQQLNENAKMLCWHHTIPEMNHNELLGWRTNTDNLAVVYFRNKSDYKRNKIRIDINKTLISKFTKNIIDVWSEGGSLIEQSLYHIHVGDWCSWYLSEMNSVNAIEIDVINFLKSELAKVR